MGPSCAGCNVNLSKWPEADVIGANAYLPTARVVISSTRDRNERRNGSVNHFRVARVFKLRSEPHSVGFTRKLS